VLRQARLHRARQAFARAVQATSPSRYGRMTRCTRQMRA
jgi:hypothetical protein